MAYCSCRASCWLCRQTWHNRKQQHWQSAGQQRQFYLNSSCGGSLQLQHGNQGPIRGRFENWILESCILIRTRPPLRRMRECPDHVIPCIHLQLTCKPKEALPGGDVVLLAHMICSPTRHDYTQPSGKYNDKNTVQKNTGAGMSFLSLTATGVTQCTVYVCVPQHSNTSYRTASRHCSDCRQTHTYAVRTKTTHTSQQLAYPHTRHPAAVEPITTSDNTHRNATQTRSLNWPFFVASSGLHLT